MERTIRAPESEFLTIKEAARFLGIPLRTLRKWIDDDLVPPPRDVSFNVKLYPWDVVVGMASLLRTGWLPRVEKVVNSASKNPDESRRKPAKPAISSDPPNGP